MCVFFVETGMGQAIKNKWKKPQMIAERDNMVVMYAAKPLKGNAKLSMKMKK